MPARTAALIIAVVATALSGARTHAQLAAHPTEPFLAADHWSRTALRRLAGAGAIESAAALDAWPLRRSEVRALLAQATEHATRLADDNALRFARDAQRAFDAEFPAAPDAPLRAGARFLTGWIESEGGLAGGASTRAPSGAWVYGGPVPGPAAAGARLGLSADIDWRGVAGGLTAASSGDIGEAYAAVRAGPVDAWAGRRALAFGVARGGDIVLSPAHALDAIGIRTAQPIGLPGPLHVFGDVRATLALSRFAHSGKVRRPWFAAASVRISPAAGFSIGLHRATLFGGADGAQPVTAKNVVLMALGLTSQLGKDSGFENQVAAIDVWLRLDPGLPLVAYAALGADDVGFSFLSTAATIVGLEAPALPGLPELSVGIEHARFPRSCCGHPPWYRHGDLGQGWTEEGRLLGHPLAGHGQEWAVHWDLAAGAIRWGGRVSGRTRDQENLFSPDHGGSSFGGAVHAVLHAGSSTRFRVAVESERGRGWQAWSGDLGLQLRVGPAARAPAPTRNAHADVRSCRIPAS